jgi:hypothetical protein
VAVIGGLASRIGLHYALVIPVVLALWIAVGASALRSRRPTAVQLSAEALAGDRRPKLQR